MVRNKQKLTSAVSKITGNDAFLKIWYKLLILWSNQNTVCPEE
jgi:hypothetical protein